MKILVAMSGGLDSSVATHLLMREGHDVTGVLMLFRPADAAGESMIERARRTARTLGIGLRIEDCAAEFDREVVQPFCEEYLRGRTPNPCVRCNRRMKFRRLLRLAEETGAERVATGHYAGVACDPASGRHVLRRAADVRKDQSYFLYGLTQDCLARTLFPLAEFTKEEVRELAAEFGFDLEGYRESQEFCFVGEHHYADFLRERFDNRFASGRIVDTEGHVLGRHHGVHRFTIGQRRHLGIAAGRPMYVLRIEPETNTVVVGPREATYASACTVSDVNWIALDGPGDGFAAAVKVRAAHPAAPARVEPAAGGAVRVVFHEPQHAITPGQAAVFYDDEKVLGGGTIETRKIAKQ